MKYRYKLLSGHRLSRFGVDCNEQGRSMRWVDLSLSPS